MTIALIRTVGRWAPVDSPHGPRKEKSLLSRDVVVRVKLRVEDAIPFG